jgi:acetyl esterase/lipase
MRALAWALRATLWMAGLAAAASAWADPPPPLPAQAFFAESELSGPVLSPSGRWLALGVQPPGQRRGLAVYDLHGGEPPRELARFSDIDIVSFYWVGEDHLAFELMNTRRGSGEQRLGAGLFTVRRDGTRLQQHILLQWWHNPGHGTRATRRLDVTHQLLHVPHTQTPGAETVIVRGARTPDKPFGDWVLKRLNIVSGEVTALNAAEPNDVHHWLFDSQGQPVYGLGSRHGRSTVYQRGTDDSGALTRRWTPLLQSPSLERPWYALTLDLAGRLYVTQPQGPRGEHVLKRFDPVRGAPEGEALAAAPGFDFRGELVQEAAAGADPVLGLRVWTDAWTTVWLHPAMAAVQQAVDARLPGRTNTLHCQRCREDDRTVVVVSSSDRHPGEIWLWRGSAQAPTAWRRLGLMRPAIDPQRMAEVVFTRYTARDGMEIPLWVTLPPGQTDPATPSPAVVLVHGGPWTRGGYWHWEPLAQFLASRGYVVLEPEFRGSTGYGERHWRAGWQQWGLAMQDDLADAAQWAVQRAGVDPRRICIAGGSYGGYAALMGLVSQAEVFRCAAAWVPLTDPQWLLREGSPDDWDDETRRFLLPTLVGDRLRDSAQLAQVSPLAQAARIRAPVLLAWGEEETRTPPHQARDMARRLRAAGQTPETVGYKGEGHHWFKTETWVDFAQRLEAFLARSLAEPPGAPRSQP